MADAMGDPVPVDGRSLDDLREVDRLGFTYRGVGLPPVPGVSPESWSDDTRSPALAISRQVATLAAD